MAKRAQERKVKMEIMGRAESCILSFFNTPVCLFEREVRDGGMTEHTLDHYNCLAHCQRHKYTPAQIFIMPSVMWRKWKFLLYAFLYSELSNRDTNMRRWQGLHSICRRVRKRYKCRAEDTMVIFHWLFLLASYPDPGSVIKPEQLNLSKKT